ncbi:cysteinyl-tRNA(Pro) deacylase [Clostridium sulfidigenes]|uniref:Cys-tRNA(Pro)/Cys-tRNA(Cys) deacylase n=1 Tax=Clostridium sulfidigenes TaxID=318464 RepID=A0A084JC63_9CLOT|nr:Cys-tRNA(Pro) deacylase [Clostridium sulfidigenes]KEZ86547.1 cysteinyl-tRNA(Pro) deacylase [Clostridium sulfidigenes]HBA03820.1 Cys-tRNA(Pro) deacylase [Clostridium sp.]
MANTKTNVMRILDNSNINYNIYTYEVKDSAVDGISVANKLGVAVEKVFKTLVTKGHGGDFYVFVVPVAKELNLKAAAKRVGEKSVEMIKVSDMLKITGYIRGGCSPIGMKKNYNTVIDDSSMNLDKIIVSGGKIGFQVEIAPKDLIQLINAETGPIVN